LRPGHVSHGRSRHFRGFSSATPPIAPAPEKKGRQSRKH
jgi:hypothetical protein